MWQCVAGCALFDYDSHRCIMLDWGNILLDCRHYRKLVPWRAYITPRPNCLVSNTCLCIHQVGDTLGIEVVVGLPKEIDEKDFLAKKKISRLSV